MGRKYIVEEVDEVPNGAWVLFKLLMLGGVMALFFAFLHK